MMGDSPIGTRYPLPVIPGTGTGNDGEHRHLRVRERTWGTAGLGTDAVDGGARGTEGLQGMGTGPGAVNGGRQRDLRVRGQTRGKGDSDGRGKWRDRGGTGTDAADGGTMGDMDGRGGRQDLRGYGQTQWTEGPQGMNELGGTGTGVGNTRPRPETEPGPPSEGCEQKRIRYRTDRGGVRRLSMGTDGRVRGQPGVRGTGQEGGFRSAQGLRERLVVSLGSEGWVSGSAREIEGRSGVSLRSQCRVRGQARGGIGHKGFEGQGFAPGNCWPGGRYPCTRRGCEGSGGRRRPPATLPPLIRHRIPGAPAVPLPVTAPLPPRSGRRLLAGEGSFPAAGAAPWRPARRGCTTLLGRDVTPGHLKAGIIWLCALNSLKGSTRPEIKYGRKVGNELVVKEGEGPLVFAVMLLNPCRASMDPGRSILRTYHLTKYLEKQLHSLSRNYMDYLGSPFNRPDFDPPRTNDTGHIPSPTLGVGAWRGLGDRQRLTENLQAYTLLLAWLGSLDAPSGPAGGLARLRAGLEGLNLGIGAILASLGYPLPREGARGCARASGPPSSRFLIKLDHYWVLRELQAWLLRTAKDFNRLRRGLGLRAGRGKA
ncbi:collagen alpha-1(I) chain [Narcine bancroftii]|uniref:collagen alpha-1(I) chain n=1 Tax=Narcine bancroftii TaxID=1343680 RepID=UPI0038323141